MIFWKILALVVVLAFLGILAVVAYKLLKAVKKENEINEMRYQREQEWHDAEAENWRRIDPSLQTRIKELEATCRDNQKLIANLRLELLNKDQFLAAIKVKDLYDQGWWPATK